MQLIKINNPFDLNDRDVKYLESNSLAEVVSLYAPLNLPCVVSVNGKIIIDNYNTIELSKDDYVVILPKVEGGGNNKQVVGMLVILASMAVGNFAAPTLASMAAEAAGFSAAVYSGMMVAIPAAAAIAGGMIVSAFTPSIGTTLANSNEKSQVYSWNPQTVQQQGLSIGRYYGTNKLTGQIISTYTESIEDKQYVYALILLGMGPFTRVAAGLEMWINNQPNPMKNYQGVEISVNLGMMNQDPLTGFNNTKIEYTPSVKVNKTDPYVYTTIGDSFDALEIDVNFPNGLWQITNEGNTESFSVAFSVEIRKVGTTDWSFLTTESINSTNSDTSYWSYGWWSDSTGEAYKNGSIWHEYLKGDSNPHSHKEGYNFYDTVAGTYAHWRWIGTSILISTSENNQWTFVGSSTKSITGTAKTKKLEIKGQYEIRVTRITDDTTDPKINSDMYLSAVREVVNDDFQYPRQALVAIKALATDQLNGSFNFACVAECLKVRVWNGSTWSVQYSNNPAWVFYDAATQPVYDNDFNVIRYEGYHPDYLGSPDHYKEWADWCDGLVNDGKGGTEKRCTFNGGFDATYNLWDALFQIAATGRAIPMFMGTKLSVVIDKPSDPVQLFTVGNIIKDEFEQSWLSLEERSKDVEIDFINEENGYEREKLAITHPTFEGTGDPASLSLFGVTKPSEIWRHGMLKLENNKYIGMFATWDADIDAIAVTIGDVCLVQHDIPKWGIAGGRIVSATSNSVTLDRSVEIESGKTYVVMVRLKDDTLITKTVTNSVGTHTVLTLSSSFSTTPEQYNLYYFAESAKQAKPFRVSNIRRTSEQRATITGIEYVDIATAVDTGTPVITNANYSYLEVRTVPAPSSLILTPKKYETNAGMSSRMDLVISWQPSTVRAVIEKIVYEVRYKLSTLVTWTTLPTTSDASVTVTALASGSYDVQVRALNDTGATSVWVSDTIEVPETTDSVPNVTGLQLDGDETATQFTGSDVKLTWNYVAPPSGLAGGLTGRANSWFRYYVVRVYTALGALRRTDYVISESYTYSYDMNRQDGSGTAQRSLRFDVTVMAAWGEESTLPASITLTNPPPAKLTGLSITGAVNLLSVGLPLPGDTDFKGFVVYASKTAGFTPSTANQINKGGPETVVTKIDIEAGTWYVKAAAYDSFGTDSLNYSDEYSVSVTSLTVTPELLDSVQRVDFFVRNTIFYFNGSTLIWDDGFIDRAETTYTLAGGSLATANACYIIANFSGSTATISKVAVGSGLPTLTYSQVIIALTSDYTTAQGNYICFVRQANSISIEGALIRSATITDAHITGTLSANKITTLNGATTLSGSGISLTSLGNTANWGSVANRPQNLASLVGTEEISNSLLNNAIADAATRANWVNINVPSRFADAPEGAGLVMTATHMGYYNGADWQTYMDYTGKFYLQGSGTHGLLWNGSTLNIRGSLNADDITAGTLNVDRITSGSIINPESAYDTSFITLTTEGNLQSKTITTTTTRPVLISIGFQAINSTSSTQLRLVRTTSGSDVVLMGPNTQNSGTGFVSITLIDTPGVGTHTYSIKATNITAQYRTLVLMELKK